jgi:hypothetical protein
VCILARACVHPGAWACACAYVHRALLIQYATPMRHIETSCVAIHSPLHFSTLSHKRCDFRKKKFLFFFFFSSFSFFLVVLFYLAGVKVTQSDLHLYRSAAKLLASFPSTFLSTRAAIKLSSHITLERPFPRLPAGLDSRAFLGSPFSDILIICPYQRS